MIPRISALQDSVQKLTKQEKLFTTNSEYILPSVPVLQSQAKRVISSAITITQARSTRSDISEGNISEAGDTMEPATVNRIATWVSNTPTLTKEAHYNGELLDSPRLLSQQSPVPKPEHLIDLDCTDTFPNEDENEEDDLVLDFVRKYLADGKEHLDSSEFADAEDCYLRALRKAENLSPNKQKKLDLESARLNLGLTAIENSHIDLAERHFRQLADECVIRRSSNLSDDSHGKQGLQACFFLAQIYLQRDELEAAEQYCMKSLQGHWKMRGRDPTAFHPSANLMSTIASRKGDEKEAKMYLKMISCEVPSPTPPTEQTPGRPLPAMSSRVRSDSSGIALQSVAELELSDPRESRSSYRPRASTKDSSASVRCSVSGSILEQDAAAADTLTENGFDVYSRSFDPDTALLWAARHGEELVMQQLISGLSVSAVNGDKKTKLRIVKVRTVDKTNDDGFTPLISATIRGHAGAVEILLLADAKINLRTKSDERRTALHFASFRSHHQIVKSLVASGADLDVSDNQGNTPLHLAVVKASPQIVSTLLKAGANREAKNSSGCTPLHVAVIERKEDIVECLLTHKVKVNAAISPSKSANSTSPISFTASWTDTTSWSTQSSIPPLQQPTALHLAATNGDTNILSVILSPQYRVNLESRTTDGRTPLHAAVLASQLPAVTLLLDHGANIEAHDLHKRTALHLVVGSGPKDHLSSSTQGQSPHISILEHLLRRSALTSAREDDGSTPLHIAAFEGDVAAVKVLLDAGADPNAKRIGGLTPGELAKKMDQVEVVRVLEERFGSGKKVKQGSRKLLGLGMGRKLTI